MKLSIIVTRVGLLLVSNISNVEMSFILLALFGSMGFVLSQ